MACSKKFQRITKMSQIKNGLYIRAVYNDKGAAMLTLVRVVKRPHLAQGTWPSSGRAMRVGVVDFPMFVSDAINPIDHPKGYAGLQHLTDFMGYEWSACFPFNNRLWSAFMAVRDNPRAFLTLISQKYAEPEHWIDYQIGSISNKPFNRIIEQGDSNVKTEYLVP